MTTDVLRCAIFRADSEYSLFENVKGILVAFSGGADSCALLHSLISLRQKYGFSVAALHVNHGIRCQEAQRDADFCREFCRQYEIPFTLKEFDVPEIAKNLGMGLEEAGRKIRYDTLEQERLSLGFDVIATAHHAGDNLETMLFNLSRGCSLAGLCGIPPKRDRIIRPLIFCSKKDIVDYCNENSIPFVTDSTNSDETYTRNYIRASVIPALEKINPDICRTAAETSALLRRDREILDGTALGEITSRALLSALPDALLSRAIIALCPDGCSPEKVHIENAIRAVRQSGRQTVFFPSSLVFICEADTVKIIPKDKITKTSPDAYDFTLEKGIIELPYDYAAGVNLAPDEKLTGNALDNYNLFAYQSISSDKIKGSIHIRTRRESDTYLLGGIRRKVKTLMQTLGKSGPERAMLPFFCDDEGICWIPGFPPRDGLAGGESGFAYYKKKEEKK